MKMERNGLAVQSWLGEMTGCLDQRIRGLQIDLARQMTAQIGTVHNQMKDLVAEISRLKTRMRIPRERLKAF